MEAADFENKPPTITGSAAQTVALPNTLTLTATARDDGRPMPPPDNKDRIPPLTPEQIGLIRAWIDQGAK